MTDERQHVRDMFMVLLGAALLRMETANLTVGQLTDLVIELLEHQGYAIQRSSK